MRDAVDILEEIVFDAWESDSWGQLQEKGNNTEGMSEKGDVSCRDVWSEL